MREVDKNSWPCSYHVDAFAFCMAVPDSALSRAEQSVERTLSRSTPERRGGAACARGVSWPVPSRSSMQLASAGPASTRSGAAPARGTRPGASRTANLATVYPPCAAKRAGGGLAYRVENMALHPAAPTPPPALTAPCIPHAPKTLTEFRIANATERHSKFGRINIVVQITWDRKSVCWKLRKALLLRGTSHPPPCGQH